MNRVDRTVHKRSRRERVLDLLTDGYSNRAIAKLLRTTTRTVKSDTRDLFEVFGFHNRNGLKRIRLAVAAYYMAHPDQYPFMDGDRAAKVGYPSAAEFARERDLKRKARHERNGQSASGASRARSKDARL